jgi:hypothetical protein
MIVDTKHDVDATLQYIQNRKTLVVPIFANPNYHVIHNPVVAIYIYTEDDVERIIPMRHTEQITGFSERLQDFLSLDNIFIHDKKRWLQIGGNDNVWDVKTLWWYTYTEAYDESHYPTAAHLFYWRRHSNMPQVNALIPLQQHLAMCQKIRHYAWPMCVNAKLTDSYLQFNSTYPKVFATIESAGLAVNDTFRMPELIYDNRVYSQYNYHTTTGRPSNAYRGFNFAAMNKEDGTREAFCSRFERGALVEMDFDSYHVRLIAKIIGYELPTSSIHDYLGRFYFGVDELTDEQRDESKAITFRLLYGGIDREFLSIEFFNRVNDFVYRLWDKWKRSGCVETPILKRNICKEDMQNMTANKLFNYYLQAIETEVSVQKMQKLQTALDSYNSCIVLYTYDSILMDVDFAEAQQILPIAKAILEEGNFPVKVKAGDNYNKMNKLSL